LVLAVYQLPAANSFLQLGVFERIQLPTPSFSVIRMGIASNRSLMLLARWLSIQNTADAG
jgi:hypothetical protein